MSAGAELYCTPEGRPTPSPLPLPRRLMWGLPGDSDQDGRGGIGTRRSKMAFEGAPPGRPHPLPAPKGSRLPDQRHRDAAHAEPRPSRAGVGWARLGPGQAAQPLHARFLRSCPLLGSGGKEALWSPPHNGASACQHTHIGSVDRTKQLHLPSAPQPSPTPAMPSARAKHFFALFTLPPAPCTCVYPTLK
ncbi:unnamed protein product [Pleuronectes platessa]|uniref:Uncharacterized protein n=1 Tax=Pleuronectes platessa TaxID=8262 RepID=A0A9N7VSB4_PLEPL|nr:unnamed protein product [Pleuronectes platessa]